MPELMRTDAELVYSHLPESIRSDLPEDPPTFDPIYEELCAMQTDSLFSPREFAVFFLDQRLSESEAAALMDISVGTYRGKKGRIKTKLREAEATLRLVESV